MAGRDVARRATGNLQACPRLLKEQSLLASETRRHSGPTDILDDSCESSVIYNPYVRDVLVRLSPIRASPTTRMVIGIGHGAVPVSGNVRLTSESDEGRQSLFSWSEFLAEGPGPEAAACLNYCAV